MKMSNNHLVQDSLLSQLAVAEESERLHRCVAPIVDCIRKMRVEGLADNQIAGLFRHAADELDEATMTNDGEVDTAA